MKGLNYNIFAKQQFEINFWSQAQGEGVQTFIENRI